MTAAAAVHGEGVHVDGPVTRLRRSLPAYAFLAPWIVGMLGITLGPMLLSLYYSFTDYSLLGDPRWAGWDNYARLLSDERFHTSLRVTFVYVALSVPLELVFALLVAVVLNRGLRGLATYRAIYYLPSLLGGSVAVAILWRQIFGRDGLVNDVLALVGIEGPGWVSSPEYSLLTLVVLRVWQFGAPMVIFLAGLRQIPDDVYEAATIDGANALQRFVRITLPLLSPIIFFNLVLQTIGAFQAFTPAFIVSGGSGGPSDSTLFYTLYLYQRAFGSFEMGYAAALAWVLLLIIGVLTGLNFLLRRYWVYSEDEPGGLR
ncbi:carbohydrate ABC transporter permease [Pseudonocardia sichuanensis]|uniref:Carbohydrate ABC transporter membrane protein 1 (CUT1 family) n=1 Tax=Pseudonocardia kunmingensis TaxID=630975 RepID=A0A543DNF1_9PSEU|nr:sugar ABC transporter permease [Pseudonocardia kunmingensis]TQM10866.1 carbohydrate ABC transporter membrane protein 1 (CUT1 family) [Pseudonocardia kunmingensis]